MPNFLTKAPRLALALSRRFLRQPSEALLLCRLAWWILVTSIVARWFSLPRALRIVSSPTGSVDCRFNQEAQQRLAQSLDLVLSADVLMFRPICWKRAAVLHRFLSQKGIRTHIRFGVRNEKSNTVSGHAWLESNGQPILEKDQPDYVVTYTFPSDEQFNLPLATLSHE